MTSYLIELQEDTLKVDFNPQVRVDGDQVVRDAEARLNELINTGELPGGKLLKIRGRISILVSYVLAHNLTHLYGAIAVSDPRLSAYVVVISTTPDYPVGSRIDFNTGKVTQVMPDQCNPYSYLLSWEEGILRSRQNQGVSIDGDQVVRDIEAQLNNLIDSGILKGGKQPLLINGRTSVLASFVIANKLAHLYSVIAAYDPKINNPNSVQSLEKYVVVISHNQSQVGETIDRPCQLVSNIKVVLGGPPNTGKTCLREGLKQALIQLSNAPESYAISGCPDGDGAWFLETARNYPQLARQLKDEYKARFTPEFATAKARDIQVIRIPILVFDVGGKLPSPENEVIMSEATHAVILAKTEEDVKQWQDFCKSLNLPVIAILYSDYEGKEDKLETESPILKGSVHKLDRQEDTSTRPMIQKLAQLIASLVNGSHELSSNAD